HTRLRDILDAIERIEKYSPQGREAFESQDWLQVWTVHHLQIIGEAARGLSDAMRERMPQVPWRSVVGMRHILVHQYFEIDTDLVWQVVEQHLPVMKTEIMKEF